MATHLTIVRDGSNMDCASIDAAQSADVVGGEPEAFEEGRALVMPRAAPVFPQSWEVMRQQPMDEAMYLHLAYVCDGQWAQATVLWDLIAHHRERGLKALLARSAANYVAQYGARMCSERSYRRALIDLEAQGLIEFEPGVRNVVRRFRLSWDSLAAALSGLEGCLPGLTMERGQ